MRFAGNRIFLALASVVIGLIASSKRGKRESLQQGLASWKADLARFTGERNQYLLY